MARANWMVCSIKPREVTANYFANSNKSVRAGDAADVRAQHLASRAEPSLRCGFTVTGS